MIVFSVLPMPVAFAQSSVAISPFVSYVRNSTTNPLAGIALTFGGTTGLALRGSADMSIANPDSSVGSGRYRPWGGDADALLFLGGLGGGATVFSRALSPYVFAGIGMTGGDSVGRNVVNHNWSYGAGATIPLGWDADIFGEARWRMSQYVLPTSRGAPDSRGELRFGLSFHVGGSSQPVSRPRRRVVYDDDGDEQVVVARQPEPVVITQPAPTATATAVNVNVPEGIQDRDSDRQSRPRARNTSVYERPIPVLSRMSLPSGRSVIRSRQRIMTSTSSVSKVIARKAASTAKTSARRSRMSVRKRG
jgi:hypothetical protein